MSGDEIPPRYELKYLVPIAQVDTLRRLIEPFCSLDPFSDAAPDKRYRITSLYLDSDALGCFRAWERAAARRFKVRVRRYGPRLGDSPVFLEVKERTLDVTRKPRARVPAADWLALARDGAGVAPAERDFCLRRDRFGLSPKLLVRYEREAWRGRGESYVRVTFDQRLEFRRCEEWSLDGEGRAFSAADDPVAFGDHTPRMLVEVKTEREVPRWLAHALRTLELERRGLSKYGVGVRRVYDRSWLLDAARREPAT